MSLDRFIKPTGRPRKIDWEKVKEEFRIIKEKEPGYELRVYYHALAERFNCTYNHIKRIIEGY